MQQGELKKLLAFAAGTVSGGALVAMIIYLLRSGA